MAQMDGFRYIENPAGEQLLPGGEEAQGHWPAPMVPTFQKGDDHEVVHDHHHPKKSVLAKVKDKAKKWKHTLAKKKHGQDSGDGANLQPTCEVSFDKEDMDKGQDAKYYAHGAPIYESERAPDAYRGAVLQNQTATPHPNPSDVSAMQQQQLQKQPNTAKGLGLQHENDTHKELHHLDAFKETPTTTVITDKHVLEAKAMDDESIAEESSGKTLTETLTEMLSPAYTVVSEATHLIASKIQGPTLTPVGEETDSEQMLDKGVSVKEYLKQKLEPGEEERELSHVISEAMSPKSTTADGGEMGVVEKVKGAVSSLLGMDEQTESPIGASTNPQTEVVEETGGRRP